MIILTTEKNIVNITKQKDFCTWVSNYSEVSRTLYPDINKNNQYKVTLKAGGFFSPEFIIGEYGTREQAHEMEKRLFEALKRNEESFEM